MISVFDLFKIGLGPSSSHTVGPMKAAKAFRDALFSEGVVNDIERVKATLYGSLAWTGKGHASDKAVLLGLMGYSPDSVDPDAADTIYADALSGAPLKFGEREIDFNLRRDIVFDTLSPPPQHPNTLAFSAEDASGAVRLEQRWLSVGGGFVQREGETAGSRGDARAAALYVPQRRRIACARAHGPAFRLLR